jgi:hypothetical protein
MSLGRIRYDSLYWSMEASPFLSKLVNKLAQHIHDSFLTDK